MTGTGYNEVNEIHLLIKIWIIFRFLYAELMEHKKCIQIL